MDFETLKNFIVDKLRQPHSYQPVLLMVLLENGGRCSEEDIARQILLHDHSQIEDYKIIAQNMAGQALQKEGVVTRDRTTKQYQLVGFESLTTGQKNELIELCQSRLDDTIEAEGRTNFDHREPGCLFCEMDQSRIVAENALMYVIRDGFPVTELHSLIIPKRHIPTFFDLGQPEITAFHQLLLASKKNIEDNDPAVIGFNIGMNNGEAAGQTIFHCHIHLIPRRQGDVENPRGGVRHTIPGKGFY